jgi:hypothetical protein
MKCLKDAKRVLCACGYQGIGQDALVATRSSDDDVWLSRVVDDSTDVNVEGLTARLVVESKVLNRIDSRHFAPTPRAES